MGTADPIPERFDLPEVSGVEELLATFLHPDGADVTDGEVLDGVVALTRLHGQVGAALAAAVGLLDARLAYAADGTRTAAAWLRSRTELSGAHASVVVHRGRDLSGTPVVRAAFGEGVLGEAKVRMLLAARNGLEALFADHEVALVELIRGLTVAHAQITVNQWRAKAEATLADDGAPPEDPADENALHLSQSWGGRWRLDGDLDAVSGQVVANALEAWISDRFHSGAAAAGDGVAPARRRAEALVDLVARGAEPGTKQGQARPSVTLNIDLAELLGLPVDGPEELRARRCGLTNATPVPRSTAERLLCSADVTAVFTEVGLDGIVEVLGAVHTNRYPTAKERRALALRDGGCVFPGCDAPVEWADAHHLDHWHVHQRTELRRLVLLCRFHHHAVHEGGFGLERSPTGIVTATRPDGTQLPRAGPGRQAVEPELPVDGTATPATPPSRFRTLTQRRDAEEREQEWYRRRILARLADLEPPEICRPDAA